MFSHKQGCLSELDNARLKVKNAQDEAVVLMNALGGSYKELVEPKLAELHRNFEKVSQHIESANVSQLYFYIKLFFIEVCI